MNNFDKACPSGNHMCEGNEDVKPRVEVGDVYKDENGVEWEVYAVDGIAVEVFPYEDQKRYYTVDELIDEMTKL